MSQFDFNKILSINSKVNIKIFNEKLLNKYSTDEDGYIYIFASELEPYEIKIGRTINSPEKRVSDWSSKNGKVYKLLYYVHVSNNKQIERLIHLALKFANMSFYVGERERQREWFNLKINNLDLNVIINVITYIIDMPENKSIKPSDILTSEKVDTTTKNKPVLNDDKIFYNTLSLKQSKKLFEPIVNDEIDEVKKFLINILKYQIMFLFQKENMYLTF